MRGLAQDVLARQDVVEEALVHDEEPAVDAEPYLRDVGDRADAAVRLSLDDVARVVGPDAQERGRPTAGRREVDHLVERRVGEPVGVVGEEPLVTVEVVAHGHQPLPHARLVPRVDERDPPIVDVGLEQLHVTPPRQHEVVGDRLVVVHEVTFDMVGAVAEAEDEVLVAVVGVVLHQVPEHRPVPDTDHRLGQRPGMLPDAHALSSAEQNDFHGCRGKIRAAGSAKSAPSPPGRETEVQTVPTRSRKTGWTGRPSKSPSTEPALSAWT